MDNATNTARSLTKEQKEFIIENFPIRGSAFCAENIPLTPRQISEWCARRKIKITEQYKKEKGIKSIAFATKVRNAGVEKKNSAELLFFTDCITKESAYILGFIWADGYVYGDSVKTEIVSDDLNEIKDVFKRNGNWALSERFRPNRRPQSNLSLHNRAFANFLKSMDYLAKSGASACKILSHIPENLHPYFFRGIFDGDGCFYINLKNYCFQISVASNFEQDWKYFEDLLSSLNIKFSVKRRIQKVKTGINKSSVIRVCNRPDILKFIEYIYGGEDELDIGLSRKFSKASIIKQYIPRRARKTNDGQKNVEGEHP